ncbi:unnamed protein product [Cuscuta europaea]|uniref:PROP1-like PPR domain-containing protein n=1 Tax=Cuscuta europaea TaxID=41803 RepID=A0A9P0YK77_CUSEU|nr:unnamed protein product [Cuscuta europaea]
MAPFKGSLCFSSQAGSDSSGEDDDDLDVFSGLNSSSITSESGSIQEGNSDNDNDSVSESETSDEDVEGLLDTEVSTTKVTKTGASSKILKSLLVASPLTVSRVMDEWIEQGKELTRADILMILRELRKRNMYGKALKLSEWLESSKHTELTDVICASRVDLIAKVRGLNQAEAYIEKIPQPLRSEIVYRALLANCVSAYNLKKSESVFNKIKDLKFPISCFTCNQLLLLYKRTDKSKISDVLLLMEKENVKPNTFTYKILIDAKGQRDDIAGMEEIVDMMKKDGVEPDMGTKRLLARTYIYRGLKNKADVVMKDMENDLTEGKYWAYTNLLPLYAILGNADEVSRIWQLCEPNPCLEQCIAAIEAWGRLKNIEKAEEVFETMIKKYPNISSKYYSPLLNAYANNKMLTKGKDLVKRMRDNGCHIGISTWNSLVKLYIEAGELGTAESILMKASEQNGMKPMLKSYIVIIEEYAKKGNVHSCEKIFLKMRQGGFSSLYWLYQTLVRAYANAKIPAYGMKERMKGDNVVPRKELHILLPQVDPFQKTALSELME